VIRPTQAAAPTPAPPAPRVFNEVDVTRLQAEIKSRYEDQNFEVQQVALIKDSDRHLSGYVKFRRASGFVRPRVMGSLSGSANSLSAHTPIDVDPESFLPSPFRHIWEEWLIVACLVGLACVVEERTALFQVPLNKFCLKLQRLFFGEFTSDDPDILIGCVPQILPVTHPVAVILHTFSPTPCPAVCPDTYINDMVNIVRMLRVNVDVNIVLWIWSKDDCT
jgi:hypothetical protein